MCFVIRQGSSRSQILSKPSRITCAISRVASSGSLRISSFVNSPPACVVLRSVAAFELWPIISPETARRYPRLCFSSHPRRRSAVAGDSPLVAAITSSQTTSRTFAFFWAEGRWISCLQLTSHADVVEQRAEVVADFFEKRLVSFMDHSAASSATSPESRRGSSRSRVRRRFWIWRLQHWPSAARTSFASSQNFARAALRQAQNREIPRCSHVSGSFRGRRRRC